MRLIDLTKPLGPATEIYTDGAYADPPITVEPWCGVAEQGFRVSRLAMGTQSGTHIDAPAHFVEAGATLDRIDIGILFGTYLHLDAEALTSQHELAERLAGRTDESILFLLAGPDGTAIIEAALDTLIRADFPLWVMAGSLSLQDQPPTALNLRLAQAGICLAEDLDTEAARSVPRAGRIAALPLRLTGVSGAPCRVVAICDDPAAGRRSCNSPRDR
jgi:arylformamidase